MPLYLDAVAGSPSVLAVVFVAWVGRLLHSRGGLVTVFARYLPGERAGAGVGVVTDVCVMFASTLVTA
jgi:hypothetical protein